MSCRAGSHIHAFPAAGIHDSSKTRPMLRSQHRCALEQEPKPCSPAIAPRTFTPSLRTICTGASCTTPPSAPSQDTTLPPTTAKVPLSTDLDFRKRRTAGTLSFSIKTLKQRGRFPTGSSRLPLELSTGETHWISYATQEDQDKSSGRLCNRVDVSMLLFVKEKDSEPLFRLSLCGADMVANVCSESGPCLYLATDEGVFEFYCSSEGDYNYRFWEAQMRYLGVKVVLPNELFVTSGGQVLGAGSFAKVFNGVHRASGKSFAIKRVPKSLVSSLPKDHMSAVHIEISVLRRINHPFIVQFQAAFEDDYFYYIVLEKLEGGNVCDWLRSHKNMPEDKARSAIARVLLALVTLRDNQVVHRDLKLENLVLEDPKDPASIKVIDFGLASFLDMPRMAMHCGSPGYVAPEIIYKRPYDGRVDMFSAGVIMYALLCGKTPFYVDGNTPSQTMLKNKQCQVSFDQKLWMGVSDEAKEFILRMLDRDPRTRISIEEALCHPWLVGKEGRQAAALAEVPESPIKRESDLVPRCCDDADHDLSQDLSTNASSSNSPVGGKTALAFQAVDDLSGAAVPPSNESELMAPRKKFQTAVTRLTLLQRSVDVRKDKERVAEAFDLVSRTAGPRLRELSKLEPPPHLVPDDDAAAADYCNRSESGEAAQQGGLMPDWGCRRTDLAALTTTAASAAAKSTMYKGGYRNRPRDQRLLLPTRTTVVSSDASTCPTQRHRGCSSQFGT